MISFYNFKVVLNTIIILVYSYLDIDLILMLFFLMTTWSVSKIEEVFFFVVLA